MWDTYTITTGPDATPPTVSLVASSNSVTAAGSVTLTATAADDVGVSKVEFYEGTTKIGEATANPYTYSVTYASADNGTHSYTAKAFDAAGNTATSSPATAVTVNIPVPVISSLTPTSGPVLGGTSVTLTGSSLTGATSVTVGGVNATSLTVNSDTSLSFITPSGQVGAANVVTTPGGTSSPATFS